MRVYDFVADKQFLLFLSRKDKAAESALVNL
jgi:hypothetical protein